MLHWYFLAKEICLNKPRASDSERDNSSIVAFGGEGYDQPVDPKIKRVWVAAGLAEAAPLFAGGLAAAFVESAATSWLAVGLGLLGTALVIAILWKKYPIPPPPIEATPKPRPKA